MRRDLYKKVKTSVFVTTLLVMTVLFTIFASFSNAATETPRLEEIWIKYIATGVIDALKAGDIDIISPDTMGGWPEIESAIDAGFTPVAELYTKIAFVVINSRDYNPVTYASLWPLNDTAFRQALAWCFGTDSKEDAIATVYGGPTNAPLDSMLSPAFANYYNPYTPIYYTSYDQAEQVLTDAGYYVSGDKLYGPNDQSLPEEISVLSYSDPEFITALYMSEQFVDAWNDFFDNHLGVTNVNFIMDAVPMWPTLLTRVWMDKDFEIAFTILQPDLGPSALSDYCASWMSYVPWGNAAGASNGYVDYLCSLTKNSLNETERIQACKDLQTMVATECWYIPIWVDYAFSVLHPDLENYIGSLGSGFENTWTWRSLKWKDPSKTSVIKWTASPPDKHYNPAYEGNAFIWACEVQLFEALLERDPWSQLKLVPWVAESYTIESITTPWENSGQKITFNIREGIYWHDSGAYNDTNDNDQWDEGETIYEYPVTAEDVAFGINFIRTFYLPNYYPIYISTGVYDATATDTYTVEIYVNSTDAWLIYSMSDWALMFPKHIWQNVHWGNVETFDPGATLYEDWTGLNPPDWTKTAPFDPVHGGMKAIIGCGPFVFDFWDDPTSIGHLIANPNYWCDWIREDVNLDLTVNILDIATAAGAFGTTPGDARWNTPSDINGDGEINILDIASIALKFGWSGI